MKRGQGGSSARVTGRWRKARRVPSDAAERGRGATFDSAPFQIRRKPSKAGALGRRGASPRTRRIRACKRVLWSRGCFRSRRAPGTSPRARVFCFCFKPCCLVGCAYYAIVALATSRRNSVGKNPNPNPMKISASGPQPCREAAPPHPQRSTGAKRSRSGPTHAAGDGRRQPEGQPQNS